MARVPRAPDGACGLRPPDGSPISRRTALLRPARRHQHRVRARGAARRGWRRAAAARVEAAALAGGPPGSAGWHLPIEPLLGVQRERPAWEAVLATLMERAR